MWSPNIERLEAAPEDPGSDYYRVPCTIQWWENITPDSKNRCIYVYICWISVSTCSQLGIFVFSFYTLCIPGYSAANDAHRSSTLRLSPAFSSSSAVKKRAFKTMRSWHQLVSVKTMRVVYIHELKYKWKNIIIYYIYSLICIYRYRLPMVACWSYKFVAKTQQCFSTSMSRFFSLWWRAKFDTLQIAIIWWSS